MGREGREKNGKRERERIYRFEYIDNSRDSDPRTPKRIQRDGYNGP